MSEFFLRIKDNTILNKKAVRKAFCELKDGAYMVKIETAKKRSTPQNAYYWSCVLPLAVNGFRDLGYDEIETTEDVHEVFKSLFLKRHMENKDGLVIEYTGSTRKLTTMEFMEYLEKIGKFCAENLYTVIPEPGQQMAIL